jgi:hypothetical protein
MSDCIAHYAVEADRIPSAMTQSTFMRDFSQGSSYILLRLPEEVAIIHQKTQWDA